jgi:hypothetical protein
MDRIAHSQISPMDTGSRVKKENQETSWCAKVRKYLGCAAITAALLAGSTEASDTKGLSMSEPPGSTLRLGDSNNLVDRNASSLATSAIDWKGSNNLTDYQYVPSPGKKLLENFKELENPGWYLGSKDTQGTSGGKTSQVEEKLSSLQKTRGIPLKRKKARLASLPKAQSDIRPKGGIPSRKAPQSAMETSLRQLEQDETKGRESLKLSKKDSLKSFTGPLEKNEAAPQDSHKALSNDKFWEVINNLLDDKKLIRDVLSLQQHNESLKEDLPSFYQKLELHKILDPLVNNQILMDRFLPMCQNPEFVECVVNKLRQSPEFVERVNELRQSPEFVEHANKLLQSPRFVKSIRPLLNKEDFTSIMQENHKEQESHARKLLWSGEGKYRSSYNNKPKKHILPLFSTIHAIADLVVSIGLYAAEISLIAEPINALFYGYRRFYEGRDVRYRPYLMQGIDWLRERNGNHRFSPMNTVNSWLRGNDIPRGFNGNGDYLSQQEEMLAFYARQHRRGRRD